MKFPPPPIEEIGGIDSADPFVSFLVCACLTCGEVGGWVRDSELDHRDGWESVHDRTTGHRTFVQLTLTRSTVEFFPAPPRPLVNPPKGNDNAR